MILKQIATSVKQRDWGAALIEIVIVVVGIFIGLQVDDWNNARKDRVAEREYLARLHQDIDTLLDLQRERVPGRLAILDNLASAAEVVFGLAPKSAWDEAACRAVSSSHIFSPLHMAVPVLNEMMAAGKMSLIEDVQLRDALSRLQIQVARSTELIARLDGSTRVLAREYPDAVRDDFVLVDDNAERRYDTQSRCDLDAIMSNPAIGNDIADNYSRYEAYSRIGLQEIHDHFLQVHTLLDQQLGLQHEPDG